MRRLVISVALAAAAVFVTPEAVEAQGSISGRVVNSVTGAPVNRAEVSITVDGRTDLRGTAPTDADGRFVCRSLPVGKYRLGAQKSGYAPMDFGATHPFMAGHVIVLAAGEQKTGIVIQLPQLAVMTGMVRDVDGEPAPRVGVQALRREFQRGKPVWLQVGWANTDSNGHFRIFHMLPGKYLISAKKFEQPPPPPPPTLNAQEQDGDTGRLIYATTYFPGTLSRQQAQTVVTGSGGDAGQRRHCPAAESANRAQRASRPSGLQAGADSHGRQSVRWQSSAESAGAVCSADAGGKRLECGQRDAIRGRTYRRRSAHVQ